MPDLNNQSATRSAPRKFICDDERLILAQIAASGATGHIIERGHETRLHEILVEDGYLAHDIALGTSRSYSRFMLTDMGRDALALKRADRLIYSGSDDQQAVDLLDADNDCSNSGGHVFVPDPKTGSRCMFCERLP